jgi:hypothetical protein
VKLKKGLRFLKKILDTDSSQIIFENIFYNQFPHSERPIYSIKGELGNTDNYRSSEKIIKILVETLNPSKDLLQRLNNDKYKYLYDIAIEQSERNRLVKVRLGESKETNAASNRALTRMINSGQVIIEGKGEDEHKGEDKSRGKLVLTPEHIKLLTTEKEILGKLQDEVTSNPADIIASYVGGSIGLVSTGLKINPEKRREVLESRIKELEAELRASRKLLAEQDMSSSYVASSASQVAKPVVGLYTSREIVGTGAVTVAGAGAPTR